MRLEERHTGAHHAYGQSGRHETEHWVCWQGESLEVAEIVAKPGCLYRNDTSRDHELCLLFDGHPGGHHTSAEWAENDDLAPPAIPHRGHIDTSPTAAPP